MSKHSQSRYYRWSVFSRLTAAIIGGYALMSMLAIAMALTLPMPRTEASMTAMMVSFIIYAGIIMAVFHARNATRAWVWLIGAMLPVSLVVWLLSSAIPT